MLTAALSAGPLAAAINHLLARQQSLRAELAAHAGKVARIDGGFFPFSLAVAPDGLFHAAGDAAPNVTIRVKPSDLPLLMSNMERAFSYVSVEGDADFAKAISALAGLRWEPEEDLAPLVGDVAAVRMVQGARAGLEAMQSGGRKLAENLAEYLLEENPTLMRRGEGDSFGAAVAALRDDVERLSKRLQALERT